MIIIVFQKELACFMSINWKKTKKNLTAERPRINMAAKYQLLMVLDEMAVINVMM